MLAVAYPHAGPRPQVQDRMGIVQLGDARGPVEREQEHMVSQVQALLFQLVIWEQVLAGAVGMVRPAVLVDVFKN